MKRPELLSRIFMTVAIVGAIGASLAVWMRTPLIHARVAENGGWNPDVIQATAGEPLALHLTSDDVVHGFAVGQMDMDAVNVEPGKVTDLTLTFDKPGIYTFFCTRWCGTNHWRMRGRIEVSGSLSDPAPASVPLYLTLGIDIDSPHDAPIVAIHEPSAIRGEQLVNQFPFTNYQLSDYYRSHSPYQVFDVLKNTPLTETQRWDVVAYIWKSNTTEDSLANGQRLFSQNCAACHGENGAGNGVFADDLKASGQSSTQTMTGSNNMKMQSPANFTDPKRMLGASPALLQGKILRGGMGTGMPMWGSIFTEEQIWDLVAYLYSFQFQYYQ